MLQITFTWPKLNDEAILYVQVEGIPEYVRAHLLRALHRLYDSLVRTHTKDPLRTFSYFSISSPRQTFSLGVDVIHSIGIIYARYVNEHRLGPSGAARCLRAIVHYPHQITSRSKFFRVTPFGSDTVVVILQHLDAYE